MIPVRRRIARLVSIGLLQLAVVSCARTPPALPSATDPLVQLRQDVLAITERPGVQRGVWGVAVHSLDRDMRLVEVNADALLVPASVVKLLSVATAAEAVGWDHRFETTLAATGPIVDGTLQGDLVVRGSGDPTIGGRGGEGLDSWIAAVRAAGIARVAGRVVGDDDAIEEPRPQLAWAWDDLGYTFGALFGALNLAENRLRVTVTPGNAAGAPAAIAVEPDAADRPLRSLIVTGAAGTAPQLWPEQRPGEPFLTVAGTIPVGATPAQLSVAAGNPTLWFARVLHRRLEAQGIPVAGGAWDVDEAMPPPDTARATPIFTHLSPPLSAIVVPLMKDSINLYAEAVMRLNAAAGALPTNDAALEAFNRRLAAWGIPRDAQQLIDGSGLSRRNVVTAQAVLTVLARMHEGSAGEPFVAALPVAGVDGSLASRMRDTPAAGNVRAKTGSMSNIRSLAGYVTSADGERLAFVAMVNHFEGTGSEANQALDALAVRLASFSRAPAPPR